MKSPSAEGAILASHAEGAILASHAEGAIFAKRAEGATPAMAQWFALKATQPDALLFFRMGDFYELFFADADAASAALDIALTSRGEHAGKPIQMCGVPVHASENYLARLIRRGFRVAVVEQMEPSGKGLIRRELVRLVTPGTITEDALLENCRPNLLLALYPVAGDIGAAWADISTGQFETDLIAAADLANLLGRLDPAEILAPRDLIPAAYASRRAPDQPAPALPQARARVAAHFNVHDLAAFGNFSDPECAAAIALLDYIRSTQVGGMPRLAHPTPGASGGIMQMDAATRASLELIQSREGGAKASLFAAIDRTIGPAGSRLLARQITAPLALLAPIEARQQRWLELLAAPAALRGLRDALRGVPDLARALARISLDRASPRDLAAVRAGLAAGVKIAALLAPLPAFAELLPALAAQPALRDLLARSLADPPPLRLDDGGVIARGYDGELDAHVQLRDQSRQAIAALQLDLAQKYGVAALKIKHHQQLGYVLEAPAIAVEKLRNFPELILRQGMANGARFTEPSLTLLDRRIAEAAQRASARECTIFAQIAAEVRTHAESIAACALALAQVDVAGSAAALAESGRWCRPILTEDEQFQIESGRHPVVESALAGKQNFVANDCDLSPDHRLLLLTGPNMAGKSTYLRQNALIAILAQSGLPVPAKRANIGLIDRLFSRVGANDDLSRGQSTFMVEMTETAAILHQAGPRSLVVIDEIGRGTATLDGLAIAWAVLEALHFSLRCRTIFATHFHELARLTGELSRLRPHQMRVKDWKGGVVFLHEVAIGAGGRSFGVHVAELAGVPALTVKRAAALLTALERDSRIFDAGSLPLFSAPEVAPVAPASPLQTLLDEINPEELSPRQALDIIYRLKSLSHRSDDPEHSIPQC